MVVCASATMSRRGRDARDVQTTRTGVPAWSGAGLMLEPPTPPAAAPRRRGLRPATSRTSRTSRSSTVRDRASRRSTPRSSSGRKTWQAEQRWPGFSRSAVAARGAGRAGQPAALQPGRRRAWSRCCPSSAGPGRPEGELAPAGLHRPGRAADRQHDGRASSSPSSRHAASGRAGLPAGHRAGQGRADGQQGISPRGPPTSSSGPRPGPSAASCRRSAPRSWTAPPAEPRPASRRAAAR